VFDIYNQAFASEGESRLKVIFVLREPVEREYVRYKMKCNDYNQSNDKMNGWFVDAVKGDGSLMTFDEYSSDVLGFLIKNNTMSYTLGLYGMRLKKWAKCFGRSQMLVLNYDEILDRPQKAQWRIQQFIGMEFAHVLAEKDDAIRTEDIPYEAVEVLEPLFRESNEEMYDFLGAYPGPWSEESPFPHFAQKVPLDT
jgi:hypothetical protein